MYDKNIWVARDLINNNSCEFLGYYGVFKPI